MKPREYQEDAIEHATGVLDAGSRFTCYSSPTGTGKSLIELLLQQRRIEAGKNCWIITPRVEIIQGMLEKLGVKVKNAAKQGLARKITTPVRLRNLLERQALDELPDELIIDEVHHSTADTYTQLRLASSVQCVGFTATPYRGTPRGTQEFRELWGEPWEILDIPDAIRDGYISCPQFRVVPLLDDDLIDTVNGEFTVRSASDLIRSRLEELIDLIAETPLDRASMLVLPGSEIVAQVEKALRERRIPTVSVTQKTTQKERQSAFAACVKGKAWLLQINVVSEGVDLPIRRIVDASSTFSPVRWMQQIGRCTRPGGVSEYICTNRNVERHGYLWAGGVPQMVLTQCMTQFTMSARSVGARAIGLEKIGKFRAVEIPMLNGLRGSMYSWQAVELSGVVKEYIAFAHPLTATPFYATRIRGNQEDGYGRWTRLDALPDMQGATPRSMPNGALTPKQANWWQRAAQRYGIDPTAEVSRKQFNLLPVLTDCGVTLV